MHILNTARSADTESSERDSSVHFIRNTIQFDKIFFLCAVAATKSTHKKLVNNWV